jgi:hypothetical protein
LKCAARTRINVIKGLTGAAMPTLIRLIVTIAILVAIAYGVMFGLVWYVKPKEGEMTVRIPAEKINPQN